jgi:hypothetical protein
MPDVGVAEIRGELERVGEEDIAEEDRRWAAAVASSAGSMHAAAAAAAPPALKEKASFESLLPSFLFARTGMLRGKVLEAAALNLGVREYLGMTPAEVQAASVAVAAKKAAADAAAKVAAEAAAKAHRQAGARARMVQDIGRRLERLVNRTDSDDEPSTHRQLQLLAANGGDITDTARPPPQRFEPSRRIRRYEASYGYFSLEAGSRTGAEDRRGLERLCRYILRPAVPLSRLSVDGEDRVVLTLRHPWRDGTTALRFEAETFVARLAALVPPRGQHTVRYHGVLAPASPLRRKVVVVRVPRTTARRCSAKDLDPLGSVGAQNVRP